MSAARQYWAARDHVLAASASHTDQDRGFEWPRMEYFNWVRDYFDVLARENERVALRVIDDDGQDVSLTFASMAGRGRQVANYLAMLGVRPGDRVLLMLGNVVPLWEVMLGAIALGAVVIPATTLLKSADLLDRVKRGNVRVVITDSVLTRRFSSLPEIPVRIAVGGAPVGWFDYADSHGMSYETPAAQPTRADAPLLLYFTSGTTARPKLVVHTHESYPIGHLSTLYWIGIRPGDVHLNLSSPGWAKHAWSCFFTPWSAEATVLAYQYERFNARALLDQLVKCAVTTFCAPPTAWRMLIQEDLVRWPVRLREVVSAGEPLNPAIIEHVREAWGLTVRDGFGQTETTAMIGNPPGRVVKLGSMGRALPGYSIALVSADGTVGSEGEICLDLSALPIGLMKGYMDDSERTAEVMRDGYYHTGDFARQDEDGNLTYVGRMDDVFKSSDYRISPFELESVLIEHPAIAEAAVVPSPDSLRLSVPKAFVALVPGALPDADTARSILQHVSARVSAFKRVRRLEFADLPKTISGKIRRVELRRVEQERFPDGARHQGEYWEEDFPELKSLPVQ